MPQRPDALKYLAFNWFAVVMTLAGLSLAWGRATPILARYNTIWIFSSAIKSEIDWRKKATSNDSCDRAPRVFLPLS